MNELKENICLLDNLVDVIKESKEITTNVEHYKYLELKLSNLFNNQIKLKFDVDNSNNAQRDIVVDYISKDRLIKTKIHILESQDKLIFFSMNIIKENEKKANKIIYKFDREENLIDIICKYNNFILNFEMKFSKESFIVSLKDYQDSYIIKRECFLSPKHFLKSELTDLLLIKHDLNIENIESENNINFLFSKLNTNNIKYILEKK